MFIQPWDAALDDAEWQTWIADGHDFGSLSVNGPPGQAPLAVPTAAQQTRRLDRIGTWNP